MGIAKVTIMIFIFNDPQPKGTESWVSSLSNATWDIGDLLLQMSIAVQIFKWRDLWQKVEEMENIFKFSENFYVKIRKFSTISSVLTAAMVKINV